jgi:hypothetical protein
MVVPGDSARDHEEAPEEDADGDSDEYEYD